MLTRGNLTSTNYEVASRLARRFRLENIATLISVSRNDRAPASARVSAVIKLLEYSDGRPGISKQVTLADVADMTDEQRQELLHALLTHYETEMPGQFKLMMTEAYADALAQQQPRRLLPRQPRFTRGIPAPSLPHHPQRQKPRSTPSSPEVEPPAPIAAEPSRLAPGERTERLPELLSPPELPPDDNIIPLPRGTHEAFRDAPINASPVNGHDHGGIHPDVLARSALPGSKAFDTAFRGYSYPWRK